MEEITDRELRYIERERKRIEDERRRTLLQLQRQRDAVTQLSAEARVQQGTLADQEREPQERVSFVSLEEEDRRPPEETLKLDYAGRLSTSDGSFYTVDDVGSQYSDDAFNTHDRRFIDRQTNIERDRQMRDSQTDIDSQLRDSQIDIDRDRQLRDSQRDKERDTRTGSEKFDMLLDRLTADIDFEKTDIDLRTKSFPDETKMKVGKILDSRLDRVHKTNKTLRK